MASVLAVVAGAPVQAANTAGEHLVDTNDDGRPDSRAFAGDDRYDTALRLAMHFANSNTPGSVSTVIVASGETQIDAVAAAGIAGYEEAPVLLTRRDQLPKGVATFIEDQGVSRVYVAGGTAVISDDVVEQIEGLDSSPSVDRVAGDNRYGTAAAMAGEIVSAARWCGSDDSAVFLANGNLVPITSAILAGPMSYRMQMPLLLTAMDMLPAETSEYIDDNDVDRVVIIGNTDEVSADVADEIAALGASVDRVAGDDAASTSVEVAKLMWGDCEGLPTDTSRVALVNAEATVDGVTGGPVAGRGIGNNDSPMAILLVGDSLPASVRDWLAATPEETGGQKTHLSLVAIGGTAVVSNSVMAAAVDAANTAPGLTTEIDVEDSTRSGEDGHNTFTVKFSDLLALNAPAPSGTGLTDAAQAQLSDTLYVNGYRASIASIAGGPNTGVAAASCSVGPEVAVTLTHNLKAGDRIEVRPTAYKFGAKDDQRLLQASSATVGLKTTPTAAPSIEVIAIEGESDLYVRSNGTGVDASKITVISRSGAEVAVSDITTATGTGTGPAVQYAAALTYKKDFDHDKDDQTPALTGAYTLAKGDSAIAARGAFTNGKGSVPSRYARDEVVSRVRSFRATSVQVGSPDTGVDDDPSTKDVMDHFVGRSVRASAYIGAGDPPETEAPSTWTTNQMRVTGLWSGDAAGAAGNDWQIAIDSNANYNAAAATPEIDVSVSNRTGVAGGGLIRVQFLAGSPTLSDLAKALMDNSEFSENFMLEYNCARGSVPVSRDAFHTAATGSDLTGGVSSVGILVTWNDWVSELAGDTPGVALRDNVLGALVPGYDEDFVNALTPIVTDNELVESQAVTALTFGAPAMSARIVFSTEDATYLPGVRTGDRRGSIAFGGSYYPKGTDTTATTDHVAVNYLADDEDKDSDNYGTDDAGTDADEAANDARTDSSEPVDNRNIGQVIRARSGSVNSHG